MCLLSQYRFRFIEHWTTRFIEHWTTICTNDFLIKICFFELGWRGATQSGDSTQMYTYFNDSSVVRVLTLRESRRKIWGIFLLECQHQAVKDWCELANAGSLSPWQRFCHLPHNAEFLAWACPLWKEKDAQWESVIKLDTKSQKVKNFTNVK